MATQQDGDDEGGVAELLEEVARRGEEADPKSVAEADEQLNELLEQVAESTAYPAVGRAAAVATAAAPSPAVLVGVPMRTARPVGLRGKRVVLAGRGVPDEIEVALAPGMSRELVERAVRARDAVVVECPPNEEPMVVGVLQTTIPRQLNLKASKIHIEAESELLLRSGRAAMRLRQDGDVEIVGSRIAAASRGLFRLVGRMLRLN